MRGFANPSSPPRANKAHNSLGGDYDTVGLYSTYPHAPGHPAAGYDRRGDFEGPTPTDAASTSSPEPPPADHSDNSAFINAESDKILMIGTWHDALPRDEQTGMMAAHGARVRQVRALTSYMSLCGTLRGRRPGCLHY